jgi:inhibitor of cysteine peptidase
MKKFIIIAGLITMPWFVFCFAEDSKQAKEIQARSGENFAITLESNRTTGYEWQLAKPLDESTVQLVSSEYLTDKTELAGAGGREVWIFKALKAGKTDISFKYVRPWEKDIPPVNEKIFVIIINEKSGKGAFNKYINNDTDGSSFQEAILLPDICDFSKCKTSDCLTEVFNKTLFAQELKYVSDNYGQRGSDWKVSGFDRIDAYVFDIGKYYDDLGIEIMATGENIVLHFDITASVNALKEKQSGL